MGARENIGWEGYGRQEKKRHERVGSGISTRAGTGEKIKKESVCYFLLLMIHTKI